MFPSPTPRRKSWPFPTQHGTNLIILLCSIILSIGGMEFGLRLFLNSTDLLNRDLLADERYGHRIAPDSAGHDAWGFRNAVVPASTDVLAVGDSMTYGVGARASHSWPSWLAQISGLSVYNTGIGGYGPVEYLKIVSDFAPQLKPSKIIVGIYFGNDIWDGWFKCQNFVDTFETLDQCRSPDSDLIFKDKQNQGFLGNIRDWLSRRSVLYQSLKYNFETMTDNLRFTEDSLRNHVSDRLVVDVDAINMAFDQSAIKVDINDTENRKGVGVLLFVMEELQDYCEDNQIDCDYILIPTKQSVYFQMLQNYTLADDRQRLQRTYNDEDKLRGILITYLEAKGIGYVDLLPILQKAVVRSDPYIYHANFDTHPNAQGYRVMGHAICDHVVGGCRSE